MPNVQRHSHNENELKLMGKVVFLYFHKAFRCIIVRLLKVFSECPFSEALRPLCFDQKLVCLSGSVFIS